MIAQAYDLAVFRKAKIEITSLKSKLLNINDEIAYK
jgi:hypothetical protein